MKFEEISELHFIAPIANVPSILKLGILSHDEASRLKAVSIADPAIQQRRQNKQLPGAGALHSYANLYFHARNPMMCKIQARRGKLTVLAIDPAVLKLPGVIVSDGNASSNYSAFFESPKGLRYLLKDLVFARDWRSSNQIIHWQQKSARCAEVLVPRLVKPDFIRRAYVCSVAAQSELKRLAPTLASTVDPDLFTI
jgi:hypothetical protein